MKARRLVPGTAIGAVAVVLLSACGSADKAPKAEVRHTAGDSAPVRSQPPNPTVPVKLVWSHVSHEPDDSSLGGTTVTYVARVTNSGASAASVAIDTRALDETNIIVGSDEETLPNIPAHSTFDFLGNIGGDLNSLTGKPASVKVTQEKDAFGMAGAVEQPMLATSELKLTAGSVDDTFSDDPYSYNAAVKVTNNTADELKGGVTQQVVLYDATGKIVGGGTGSSDNVPDTLPAGMSYREQWTGVGATAHATRAVYTVWPE